MMHRRAISGFLLGSAAASLAFPKSAEAQTCSSPCYPVTQAEMTAGVTPVNTGIPSHVQCGYVLLERYGGAGDGATANDTPFAQARKVAGVFDGVIALSGGTWNFTAPLIIGLAGQGARLIGFGQPTVMFTGTFTADCVQLGGDAYGQIEVRDLVINCNNKGQDGLALYSGENPIIDNVSVENSWRHGFSIACSAFQWVENGEFDLTISNAGQHAVAMVLSGSNGAYINECLWKRLAVRGISRNAAGGLMILFNGLATGGGSKFGNHVFLKSNFDAQYQAGNPIPSSNIIQAAGSPGNDVQNPIFISGGWENTGSGTIAPGYILATSGGAGATISAPTLIGIILSSVGGLGIQSGISSSLIDGELRSVVSIGASSSGNMDFPGATTSFNPAGSFLPSFILRLTSSQYSGSGNVIMRGYHIFVRPDLATVVVTQIWDGSSANEIAGVSFSVVSPNTLRVAITTGSAHSSGGGNTAIYGNLMRSALV